MNIKLYTRPDYMDCRSLASATERTDVTAAKEKRQNYDTVTIHTDFSKVMAQKAAGDGEDSTTARILSLRQQVAAGTYQPNARRIAECMLERRLAGIS